MRTFTNSLAWQRRMFDWDPSKPTTVLLRDFTDYGNAHAHVEPRDLLEFDIAPMSHTFETFPASERLYPLMNHEVIHRVQGDIANDQDRRWRRWLLGKVAAEPQNPESLLYSYLTVPRDTTPRWYAEGNAVFFETWMAGGLGRAQGGYDEMVFRAMVRDARALLRSSRARFRRLQGELSGGRTRISMARASPPGLRTPIRRKSSSPGPGATKAASATTPTSSGMSSGYRWNTPGRTGSRSSTNSSNATSPKCANSRSPPTRGWSGERWVRYRACSTTRPPLPCMAAVRYPGISSTSPR